MVRHLEGSGINREENQKNGPKEKLLSGPGHASFAVIRANGLSTGGGGFTRHGPNMFS